MVISSKSILYINSSRLKLIAQSFSTIKTIRLRYVRAEDKWQLHPFPHLFVNASWRDFSLQRTKKMASTVSRSRTMKKKSRKKATDSELKLANVTCPVCLSILIEPVTMPCSHELCMPCFKQYVEETSLLCPVCRKRISTWARQASREGTLINKRRWKMIKQCFPENVKRRLNGDESDDENRNSGKCE